MNTVISFAREEWKEINLGEEVINETHLEISSFGRIRSFNKVSKGKVLKGSMINGYRIIRQKLFKERDSKTSERLKALQDECQKHTKKLAFLKKKLQSKSIKISERVLLVQESESENLLLKEAKIRYASFYKKDLKKRTIYYGALLHRLVAENFIPRESDDKTVVAHLDHDKLNNQVSNLRWMDLQENSKHQQTSPFVIADKEKRKQSGFYDAGYRKLSLTKVMYLKKLLNQGVSVRNLARQFKVTETQISKIKNKQNWGSVEAAN